MAKRCFRLKKSKEITGVFNHGKRVYTETVTVVYLPAKELRFAVCVGKKHGKSVARNRIKRLVREAFACYSAQIKQKGSLLFLPKVQKEYSYSAFKRDIGKALAKGQLL